MDTTHDWRLSVDESHVRAVREQPEMFAPGGVGHLLLEVLGCVADEADAVGGTRTRCEVTLLSDGTMRVRDHGRGTDTRRDGHGRMMRKPELATKDLRLLDTPSAQVLPDGRPRRACPLVLRGVTGWCTRTDDGTVHGASGTYVGWPVEEVIELEPGGTTGTLVHFQPNTAPAAVHDGDRAWLQSEWPMLHLTCGADTG